jgi:hypothetical protein
MSIVMVIYSFQIVWVHGYNGNRRTLGKFGTDVFQHVLSPHSIISVIIVIIYFFIGI